MYMEEQCSFSQLPMRTWSASCVSEFETPVPVNQALLFRNKQLQALLPQKNTGFLLFHQPLICATRMPLLLPPYPKRNTIMHKMVMPELTIKDFSGILSWSTPGYLTGDTRKRPVARGFCVIELQNKPGNQPALLFMPNCCPDGGGRGL